MGGKIMYFPYVRGRQYELLALRELVEKELLSRYVLPIIEPVKLSSTLFKTISEFIRKNKRFCIVCNPAVGSFSSDMKLEEEDENRKKFIDLLSSPCVIKSHIMNLNSDKELLSWEKEIGIEKEEWLVINNNRDCLGKYQTVFSIDSPQYVLIPDEFRRKVRSGNKILFEDRFEKCDRNSDYRNNEDEFFSEDHLFYDSEGFLGFADYSIVGKAYLEAGFAPYAVAIHIIYFDKDKTLRIHHFVSKSNSDIQNPAKKFYEAVEQLVAWVEKKNIPHTLGLKYFLNHYKDQTYPGLGSVKKFSLMHHLELVGNYLDKVK